MAGRRNYNTVLSNLVDESEFFSQETSVTINDVLYEGVILKFDKSAVRFIAKYTNSLFKSRGIPMENRPIPINHPHFKAAIKQWKEQTGKNFNANRHGVRVLDEIQAGLNPHRENAMIGLMLLSMMRDEFKVTSDGGIETRFDVEIPEEYWQFGILSDGDFDEEDTEISELEKLLDKGNFVYEPEITIQKNEIESMIAVCMVAMYGDKDFRAELLRAYARAGKAFKNSDLYDLVDAYGTGSEDEDDEGAIFQLTVSSGNPVPPRRKKSTDVNRENA